MHYGVRTGARKRRLDLFPVSQIALDEFRARVRGASMAFAKIIEDCGFMAFIEKQFGANAPDITGAADDENFHARWENAARFTLGQSGVRGVIWATVFPFFFSRAAIICRAQWCLARGVSTLKLCSSDPHCRISISTWRTPERLISRRSACKGR